jgi:hypothetical protein
MALLADEHNAILPDESDLDAAPALSLVSGRRSVAGAVLRPRIARLVTVDVS